jgi:hypothetical protein
MKKFRLAKIFILIGLLLCVLASVPPCAGYGIVYNGEAGNNPRLPQGETENYQINVFNVGKGKGYFVTVSENDITVTTAEGQQTPSEWWTFSVSPEPQIFEVDLGWKTENLSANFYIPDTDFLSSQPDNFPDGFDSWVKFGENRYALARMVIITVTASENVPRGEYQLHVPFVGRENSQLTGTGLEVAIAYEAKPKFYVIGPPPAPAIVPPPVWAAILAIGAFFCITAIAAYRIRKGAKAAGRAKVKGRKRGRRGRPRKMSR